MKRIIGVYNTAEAKYDSCLEFQVSFKVEGDEGLDVKSLNLITSGTSLLDGKLIIKQSLIGHACSKDETRGLSGSVRIAYSERSDLIEVVTPVKDIASKIYEQHQLVINEVESAYRNGKVLPSKIGPLELIQ